MVSALVFGLLVAAVHAALEKTIIENARKKLYGEMEALFEKGSTFTPVATPEGEVLYYRVVGTDQQPAEYALVDEGGGFVDKIRLLVAVDEKIQMLRGFAVLKSSETPGFGDKIKEDPFHGQFVQCPGDRKLMVVKTGDRAKVDSEIVAITGATISSEAVVKIVNDVLRNLRDLKTASGPSSGTGK